MVDWQTKDKEGNTLIFRVKDVERQKFYMELHELFVLDSAVYLYLWRADCDMEEIRNSVNMWLNLLQSCVPKVSVLAVVTHVDCVAQ